MHSWHLPLLGCRSCPQNGWSCVGFLLLLFDHRGWVSGATALGPGPFALTLLERLRLLPLELFRGELLSSLMTALMAAMSRSSLASLRTLPSFLAADMLRRGSEVVLQRDKQFLALAKEGRTFLFLEKEGYPSLSSLREATLPQTLVAHPHTVYHCLSSRRLAGSAPMLTSGHNKEVILRSKPKPQMTSRSSTAPSLTSFPRRHTT